MNFSKVVLSAFVFATVIAVGSASAACTNASLKGSYGAQEFGDKLPAYGVTQTHFVFDGAGNVSGALTNSVNGTVTTISFTGTYSVSKNCTGSYNITYSNSDTASANIVLDYAGKGFQVIRTDSGYGEGGFALAQGTTPCGLTKKTTYAANLGGSAGTHSITSVGQALLDGKGAISGSVTVSFDGTILTKVPVTGSYTANPDCTGTAQVTVSGFPTANYNLVIISGNKSVMMIETDANTIVTGSLNQ